MVSEHVLYKRLWRASRIVLANAFSINMLADSDVKVRFAKVSVEDVKRAIIYAMKKGKEVKSVIGHQSTAELLTSLLGYKVEANREEYKMHGEDLLIVVQLRERLQEGQVLSREEIEQKLKEGKIEFWVAWRI